MRNRCTLPAAIFMLFGCAPAISSRESRSCEWQPQGTIREEPDRFSGVRAVSLEPLLWGPTTPAGAGGLCYYHTMLVVQVLFERTSAGDTRDPVHVGGVHWTLESLTPPGPSHEFILTLDQDRRIRLEIHSYEQRETDGGTTYQVIGHLDGWGLSTVARANTVEVSVGQIRAVLDDDQLGGIRRLTRRVGL